MIFGVRAAITISIIHHAAAVGLRDSPLAATVADTSVDCGCLWIQIFSGSLISLNRVADVPLDNGTSSISYMRKLLELELSTLMLILDRRSIKQR